MKDHRLIDRRSLALDALTAQKIAVDPALVERAQATLARWLQTCSPGAEPALREWEAILAGPRDELLALLAGTDERAVRLRQSSPFAGALSVRERTAIFREFQRHESDAA